MSRLTDILWIGASLLGVASASSNLGYVFEGALDDYPGWLLGALALGAALQIVAAVVLIWRRSFSAALGLAFVSLGFAIVEGSTFAGVFYARDFTSTAATVLVLAGMATRPR
jgi:hypothetical protein